LTNQLWYGSRRAEKNCPPRDRKNCPPRDRPGGDLSSASAYSRSREPTPAACFLHASRNFRSLRGCQILVRGQLLLHLAAFWCVESLLDFFAWSERRARLVWCARASDQVQRGGKQSEDEHSPHWSDGAHAHVAAQPNPAINSRRLICSNDMQTPTSGRRADKAL
jgi:hypothetical protein